MEERRLQSKLTTFHRSRLKLLDVPTDHLKLNTRPSRRQDGPCFTRLKSNINAHKFSFYPSTTVLWNTLSSELKNSTCIDLDAFNREVSKLTI